MHEHLIIDEQGDTVDVAEFCCDACHREWCDRTGIAYEGWDGCHETEPTTYCDACGVAIPGQDACTHQRDNVVVNRFLSTEGEKCKHGRWIQVPAGHLTATWS